MKSNESRNKAKEMQFLAMVASPVFVPFFQKVEQNMKKN